MYADDLPAVTIIHYNSNLAGSTGVTGYIGGDVLSQLHLQYPDVVFRVLVRTTDKRQQIQAQYPGVQLLLGDLSDTALLQQESADADIIIRELLLLSD